MTEQDLNDLSINNLFTLLTKTLNELFAMERHKEEKTAINGKKKEVECIQRVLIAKRKASPPTN